MKIVCFETYSRNKILKNTYTQISQALDSGETNVFQHIKQTSAYLSNNSLAISVSDVLYILHFMDVFASTLE